jgi:hypothetical protein
MKKIFSLFAAVLFAGSMMADEVVGTINFGSASGSLNVNALSVKGNDSQDVEWTVTTTFGGETSFTPNSGWAQIGSAKKPAATITFTATLPAAQKIKNFEAKFGGFKDTAGDIVLKIGEEEVGTGALNASNDVVVSSTKETEGTVLTVTVTNIAKGVKAYYISYSYEAEAPAVAKPAIAGEVDFLDETEVTFSCETEDAKIYYTLDGTDPDAEATEYLGLAVKLTETTTVKAIAIKGEEKSAIATKEFVKANVLTVAEAHEALASKSFIAGQYVAGIISQIDGFNDTYKSITYWISDDGTTANQFEVYSGKGLNGADFTAVTDLHVGDKVTVFGDIKVYNAIHEFDKTSKIVKYEAASEPTAVDNTEVNAKAVKFFENGQLVIIKNGVKYNATGAIVK